MDLVVLRIYDKRPIVFKAPSVAHWILLASVFLHMEAQEQHFVVSCRGSIGIHLYIKSQLVPIYVGPGGQDVVYVSRRIIYVLG